MSVTDSLVQSNRTISGSGGGLSGFATVTLSGTRLIENAAGAEGGGVYAGSGLTVTSSRFSANMSDYAGGGLYQYNGSARIVNTLFDRNMAGGAALWFQATSLVSILHTTIASPTRAASAAFVVQAGALLVTNTIIASHTVGIQRNGGTVLENFNLFFGNGTDRSAGVPVGPNSLSGNPRFANVWAGDHHLTEASPARNTGVNAGITTDFEGHPRPIGGAYDMGYDEWLPPRAYVPLIAR
jgi:hypothetical protein